MGIYANVYVLQDSKVHWTTTCGMFASRQRPTTSPSRIGMSGAVIGTLISILAPPRNHQWGSCVFCRKDDHAINRQAEVDAHTYAVNKKLSFVLNMTCTWFMCVSFKYKCSCPQIVQYYISYVLKKCIFFKDIFKSSIENGFNCLTFT